MCMLPYFAIFYVLFNATATTEIYTYRHTRSLHGARPIYGLPKCCGAGWRVNVGVRVIETKQTSDGFIIGGTVPEFTNPFGGFTPSRAQRSYTDILPSANLSVDLSDQVVLRFAAGKTVTRPDLDRKSVV